MQSPYAAADSLAARDDRGGTLDIAAISRALWAKRVWILGPAVAALILSAIAVELIPPSYKSAANIFLQSQESSFTRPTMDQQPQSDAVIDDQAVASQVQVIMSRDLARQAIAKLDLARNPEFDPLAGGLDPFRRALVVMGLMRNPLLKTPEERVLDNYFDALSAYQIEKSRVIAVEFSSRDPELAARAANTIADLYISTQQAAKRTESQDASEALSPQIDALRLKVAKAEAAVEDYRSNNSLFTTTQNNDTLATQQLGDINTQLASARSQQADAEAKSKLLHQLIASHSPIEVNEITNNDLIRRLIEQRVNLRAQLAQESETLLPGHPRIKELTAQLANLESQIAVEAQRTVRSLDNDAKVAAGRVSSLQQQLDHQKGTTSTSNDKEVQLRALELEAKSDRDLLESYLSRYREASARASFSELPADARVISQGNPATTPYFPRKLPIIFIATMAALVLSSAIVTMMELLSGRAYSAGYDEAAAASPAMSVDRRRPVILDDEDMAAHDGEAIGNDGEIAMPGAAAHAIAEETAPYIADEPERLSPFEAFAGRFMEKGNPAHRVLFTSVAPRDLVEETADRFADRIVRTGMRAIIVDLDLGLDAEVGGEAGLGDLIAGKASFIDVIHRRPASRVHHVAAGLAPTEIEPDELAERMGFVFDALSSTYDAVIFVSGVPFEPAIGIGAASIAPVCDATAIVSPSVEAEEQVAAWHRRLVDAGVEDITVILPDDAATQRAAA